MVRRLRSRAQGAVHLGLAKVMAERGYIMAKIEKILVKQQAAMLARTANDATLLANPLQWLREAGEGVRSRKLQVLQQEFAANTRQLQQQALTHKIELVLQKWVANPALQGTGSWQEASSQTPQEIDEVIYPLYPLIPDPAACTHSGRGRTIYFRSHADVAKGALANTGAALLPYNPNPSPAELKALTGFLGRGGKLGVFYGASPALAVERTRPGGTSCIASSNWPT